MITEKKFRQMLKIMPVIAVDGVVIKDGTVLMVKRTYAPFKDHWVVPGGFVEYKEKIEDAIIRETKEESGFDAKVKKLVGIYSDPERDPRGHIISICFLLELKGGKAKTSSETSEVKFFKKLPDKIGADYRKMIEDARKLIKK